MDEGKPFSVDAFVVAVINWRRGFAIQRRLPCINHAAIICFFSDFVYAMQPAKTSFDIMLLRRRWGQCNNRVDELVCLRVMRTTIEETDTCNTVNAKTWCWCIWFRCHNKMKNINCDRKMKNDIVMQLIVVGRGCGRDVFYHVHCLIVSLHASLLFLNPGWIRTVSKGLQL